MNNIERWVLRWIGENLDSPDVFAEGSDDYAFLRSLCNNAITELCVATGCYTQTFLVTLREGRWAYRFTETLDHYLYPIEVLDRSTGRKLIQTSLEELAQTDAWWLKSNGYPTHYLPLAHNCIGIYRKPGETGRVIEVKAAAVPKAYGEDDIPQLRANFERAAAMYAVSEYYASRGDAKRATEAMGEYLELAGLQRLMPDRTDLPAIGGRNDFPRF